MEYAFGTDEDDFGSIRTSKIWIGITIALIVVKLYPSISALIWIYIIIIKIYCISCRASTPTSQNPFMMDISIVQIFLTVLNKDLFVKETALELLNKEKIYIRFNNYNWFYKPYWITRSNSSCLFYW